MRMTSFDWGYSVPYFLCSVASMDKDNPFFLFVQLACSLGYVIYCGYNVGPTCGLITAICAGSLVTLIVVNFAYKEISFRLRMRKFLKEWEKQNENEEI